nr:MAG TPA: hypothetical protein [Microviridae sp.]
MNALLLKTIRSILLTFILITRRSVVVDSLFFLLSYLFLSLCTGL